MLKELIMQKIKEDPDFVKCSKHGNSLIKYLSANPGEIKDKTIARLLMVSEEEIEKIYQEAIDLLKRDVR
jgi:hypothetical protein